MKRWAWAFLLAGCAGYDEANRTAAHLADSTDAYLREVGGKLTAEQAFYERARADFEAQRRRETEATLAWETAQPPLEAIDLVESLAGDEEALRRPGDFYDALLEANARREAEAREEAAERAALRRAYSENLADLELKRSELARLRGVFESLAKELSIDARVAYIERLAIHARATLKRLKP